MLNMINFHTVRRIYHNAVHEYCWSFAIVPSTATLGIPSGSALLSAPIVLAQYWHHVRVDQCNDALCEREEPTVMFNAVARLSNFFRHPSPSHFLARGRFDRFKDVGEAAYVCGFDGAKASAVIRKFYVPIWTYRIDYFLKIKTHTVRLKSFKATDGVNAIIFQITNIKARAMKTITVYANHLLTFMEHGSLPCWLGFGCWRIAASHALCSEKFTDLQFGVRPDSPPVSQALDQASILDGEIPETVLTNPVFRKEFLDVC